MSKKARLRKQAAIQAAQRKEQEQEERSRDEKAKKTRSKSAKKLIAKTKEPVIFTILRVLMLVPFFYSGFYYGGILVSGIFGHYIEPAPPAWVGRCVLIGLILLTAGVVIEFLKKHIPSFILIISGTLSYLKGVNYLIAYIQKRLDEVYVEEALQNMDKVYMRRHYPIIGTAVLSFVILLIYIIRTLRRKKKAKYLKDTAPVRSIVD